MVRRFNQDSTARERFLIIAEIGSGCKKIDEAAGYFS